MAYNDVVQSIANAIKDALTLDDVVNGEPNTQAKSRLGRLIYTLATINHRVDIATIQANQKITELQAAINQAAAAGAGTNGWTANLVLDPSQNKLQSEINASTLPVVKTDLYYGIAGAGDETQKLQTAFNQKNINLVNNVINITSRITATSKKIDAQNTAIKSSGAIIPIFTDVNDNFKISGVTIDAQNGGQLDAGLLQINASKNFLVADVVLRNGGTAGAASPKGVNAVSVATSSYPNSGKSTGNITRVTANNFTKAPVNWTTFAEEGTLSFSKFYDLVGNGYTPGIQVNGGKRFKAFGNHVFRTEGAGVAIGTVGTTPPLAASDCQFMGNTYYDIGTLGVYNAEEHAFNIVDGTSGSNPVNDIFVSNEVLYRAKQGFARIAYANNCNFNNNYSRETWGVYRIKNATNVVINNHIADNFNFDAAEISAYAIVDSSNVMISGGSVSSSSALSYLLSGSGANSNITLRDVVLKDKNINILKNTDFQFFKNTSIKLTRFVTVAAGEVYTIFTAQLLDGRTLQAKVTASTIVNATVYSEQTHTALLTASGGAITAAKTTMTVDNKSTITGLLYDVTGSNNARYRINNNTTSDALYKIDIELLIN